MHQAPNAHMIKQTQKTKERAKRKCNEARGRRHLKRYVESLEKGSAAHSLATGATVH